MSLTETAPSANMSISLPAMLAAWAYGAEGQAQMPRMIMDAKVFGIQYRAASSEK
jgi:hypothetical protein